MRSDDFTVCCLINSKVKASNKDIVEAKAKEIFKGDNNKEKKSPNIHFESKY